MESNFVHFPFWNGAVHKTSESYFKVSCAGSKTKGVQLLTSTVLFHVFPDLETFPGGNWKIWRRSHGFGVSHVS